MFICKKQKVIFLLLVITILFIWIHSMMPPETSSMESSWVKKLVSPFLELFVGKGNVTDHLVRKLAHFCEFSLLGFELLFFFRFSFSRPWLVSWNCGLISALIDETIQLFSGRGSAIPDVWLDFAGVIFGTLVAAVISAIIGKMKKQNT